MSDMTLAPRRRPLWRLFIMPVLLLIAAAAWSAFWFFAASEVEVRADAWRAQEAKSGRVYDCAKRSVAGFPFRLEVRCDGASVSLVSQTAEQAATQTPVMAKLGEILVVAQIYDPKLLIAEFTAPATIAGSGQQASMLVNWSKAGGAACWLPAACPSCSMTPRSTASTARCRRAGTRQTCRAAWPPAEGSPADPCHRNRAEDRSWQPAGAASGAVSTVRCRRARHAERVEGFSPKPRPERFRKSRLSAAMSRSCSRGFNR
jgi:hypothetical protein